MGKAKQAELAGMEERLDLYSPVCSNPEYPLPWQVGGQPRQSARFLDRISIAM